MDRPEAEWKRTDNAHEAIIGAMDFDLAQRVMRLDTRSAPGKDKVYLFSGVLICGCCGGRMIRKTNRHKGREYFYYYCPTGKKNGCTGAVMLREDDLSECVLESVKAHIAGVASLERVLACGDHHTAAQVLSAQIRNQIAENEKQLRNIGGFKSSLYENMVSGVITKEDYKSYKANYLADENRLREAIAVLEAELEEALAGKAERLRWMEHFKRFDCLMSLDRRIVVNLIQSIRIAGKTELDITFNFQAEYEQALAFVGSAVGWEVA